MNQPDGNSARDPQEHAEELDWVSYLDEVPDREDYEDDPPDADGIVMCQACGKRPASVTLLLGDVIGIVQVCSICAHLLLTTTQAAHGEDDE